MLTEELTEETVVRAMRAARLAPTPERVTKAKAIRDLWTQRSQSAGRDPWAETKKRQAEEEATIRRMFQDRQTHGMDPETLANVDRTLGQFGNRYEVFNEQFLTRALKIPKDAARSGRKEYLRAYSKKFFGEEIDDDATFAARLGDQFDLEDRITEKATAAAVGAMDPLDALAKLDEEEGASPVYSTRTKEYHDQFAKVAEAASRRLAPHRAAVAEVSEILKETMGVREQGETEKFRDARGRTFEREAEPLDISDENYRTLARRIMEVPKEDRSLVLAAIAATAGEDRKGVMQKLAESFARGVEDYFEGIPAQIDRNSAMAIRTIILAGPSVPEADANDPEAYLRAAATKARQAIGGSAGAAAIADAVSGGPEAQAPEEVRREALALADELVEAIDMRGRLRQIAENDLDPVTSDSVVMRGFYAAARSAPFTIAAVLPGGFVLNSAVMSEHSYQALRAANPDMDAQTAQTISLFAGPVQGYLERISGNILTGKLPAFNRWANQPILTGRGIAGRAGSRLLGATGIEIVQENLQDATPFLAQSALAALSEDVPDVPWGEIYGNLAEQQTELFFAVLPLALIGAGVGTVRDYRGSQRLMQSAELLRATGVSEADAAEIRARAVSGDVEGAQAELRRAFAEGGQDQKEVAETIAAAVPTILAERDRLRKAIEGGQDLDIVPGIQKTAEGYKLHFRDGTQTTFETYEEASERMEQIARESVVRLHEDVIGSIRKISAGIETGRGLRYLFNPGAPVVRDAVDAGTLTEEEARSAVEIAETINPEARKEFETARVEADLAAAGRDDALATTPILGSSVNEFVDGVVWTTARLYQGASVETVIEEKFEGDAKYLIDQGGMRPWMIDALREWERISGDRLLASDKPTNRNLVEAWSAFGRAWFVATNEGMGLTKAKIEKLFQSQLSGVLTAAAAHFGATMRRVALIEQAIADGKLDRGNLAGIAEMLDFYSGMSEERSFQKAVEREAEQIAEEIGETFSLDLRPTRHRVFDGGSPIRVQGEGVFEAKDESIAYRITGQSQIDDIIASGEVRAREGKMRGGRSGETQWSRGHESLGYRAATNEGRFVIATRADGLNDRDGGLPASEIISIHKAEGGQWVDVTSEVIGAVVAEPGQFPTTTGTTFSVMLTNAERLKEEIAAMSADEVRAELEAARLTPTKQMVELLGEFPEYLNPVIDYIVNKRADLISGNIKIRDVAKAYWITIASIGADAIDVETIRRQAASIGVAFDPDPMFLSYGAKGQAQMRPEELAAYWLGTPEGQAALDNLEAGKFDPSDWETGLQLRDAFGRNDLREKTTSAGAYVPGGFGKPKAKQFNFHNLAEVVDAINASKGKPDKLEKALKGLNGIGEGKKGFIGHMLGFGDWATLDAVELNIWLTGSGETTYLSEAKKRIAGIAKRASGSKSESADLFSRIRKRIKGLRKTAAGGTAIPEEVAAHVIHHWIWDRAKGIETTHQGVYHAMETYSILVGSSNALADSKNIPGTVPQDLVGKPFLPIMADLIGSGSAFGVDLQGGPAWPLLTHDPSDPEKTTAVWASMEAGVRAILSTLKKSGAIFTDEEGKRKAIVAPFAMSQDAHGSNSSFQRVVFNAVEDAINSGRLDQKQESDLSDLVRTKATRKKSGTERLRQFPIRFSASQFEDYITSLSFEERRFVIDVLASAEAEKIGLPSIAMMLNETRDPSLFSLETGTIVSLLEVDVDALEKGLKEKGSLTAEKFGVQKHLSYDTMVPGKILTHFRNPVPLDLVGGRMLKEMRRKSPQSRPDYLLQGSRLPQGIPAPLLDAATVGVVNAAQSNPLSAAEAKAVSAAVMDEWMTLDQSNGKGVAEFIRSIRNNKAGETLTNYDEKEVRSWLKAGHMRIFKLGDFDVWFAIKVGKLDGSGKRIEDDGVRELVGVTSNVPVKGMLNLIMAKALQEGANKLDCFSVKSDKFPEGFLPTLYKNHGWETTGSVPYDPLYRDEGDERTDDQLLVLDAKRQKIWGETGWDKARHGLPDVVFMKHDGGRIGLDDAGSLAAGRARRARGEAVQVAGVQRRNRKGSPDGRVAQGNAGDGQRLLPRGSDRLHAFARSATPEQLRAAGIDPAKRKQILRAFGAETTYSLLPDSRITPEQDAEYLDPDDLLPVSNRKEAERLFADGYRIYSFHELDDELIRINSRETLDSYNEFVYDPVRQGDTTASNSLLPGGANLSGEFDRIFSPFQRSPELRMLLGQEMRRRVGDVEKRLAPILRANRTKKDIAAERKRRQEEGFTDKLERLGSGIFDALSAASITDDSARPILTELLRQQVGTRKDGKTFRYWTGSLMSKAEAKRRGIETEGKGEWDDIPEGLPSYVWGGSIMPDQAAEMFGFDRVSDFWDALRSEIESWNARQEEAAGAAREIADAKREAREEAQQWEEQALRERETVGSDRATLLGFLRSLEAITRALPFEVRGRIGGAVALAKLKTPAAMLDELEYRVGKIDRELEKWMRKEAEKRRKKLFKRAEPKRESGKKPKGRVGADVHDLFDTLRQAIFWDGDRAEAWADDLERKIDGGEMTVEEEAHAQHEANLVRLFADWPNADAARRTAAVEAAEIVFLEGYAAEKERVARERERRQGMRDALVADAGTTGKRSERERKRIKDASAVGSMKASFLWLFNFQQVAGWTFGENSKTALWFADRFREAENRRDDEVFAVAESVEELFTRLAGGSRLAGERLQWRMSQPSIETTEAGPMSELQAITAILMERQEDGRRHLRGKRDENGNVISSWHYPETFAANLEANLSNEGLAVLDWIADQYGGEWETLNPIFRELNGIDLPRHENYAPLSVAPQQAPGGQTLDPNGSGNMTTGSRTPGSLRSRAQTVAEPRFEDAISKFLSHKREIAHYKAFAKINADAQGVLNNREVGNAAQAAAGEEALSALRTWLDFYAQGGFRDAGAHGRFRQILNAITGRASAMALVGRIGTLAVQATQLSAAAAKMPFRSYLKRLSLLFAGRLEWKAALDSPYIQRRLKQMPVAVQLAMDGLRASEPNRVKHAARELGKLLSGADALFTAGTYAIVYDYQRTQAINSGANAAAAEEIARREAERITDEIAQPTRQGARSLFELTHTGPLARMGWAFASEARKNLGAAIYSSSKRTPAEAARAWFGLIILNGVLSALIRTAWRDLRSEEEDDDELWNPRRLLIAASSEWLYGFPLLGEAAQEAIYAAAGEWKPSGGIVSAKNAPRAIRRAPENLGNLLEGDFEQPLRDLETLLMAAGLANDTIAGAASFSHLLRDAEALLRNATSD